MQKLKIGFFSRLLYRGRAVVRCARGSVSGEQERQGCVEAVVGPCGGVRAAEAWAQPAGREGRGERSQEFEEQEGQGLETHLVVSTGGEAVRSV